MPQITALSLGCKEAYKRLQIHVTGRCKRCGIMFMILPLPIARSTGLHSVEPSWMNHTSPCLKTHSNLPVFTSLILFII